MKQIWLAQTLAVARLEIKKTFFAKRGIWIYLLALAPVGLFFAKSLHDIYTHGVHHDMAAAQTRQLSQRDFDAIQDGMTREQVIQTLGNPPASRMGMRRQRRGPGQLEIIPSEIFRYSDGEQELNVTFENGLVVGKSFNSGMGFGQMTYVFAGVFEFFFIRLAVFFGCLGIFMNLFRGEMLDKSLHFYLLAPVRREILLAGKYLAGLLAASVIFTVSTALQFVALSLAYDANTISRYLYQDHGLSHIGAYLGVTLLACIGYGSVFLAAGLLFRNPIVPAAAVLIWEAANPLLPALLKKFSVIYYLKSLCPVQIPVDPGMPALLTLLISNADPISGYVAVFGLIGLAIAVLWASSVRVRRLEINYTTE